MSEAIDLFTKYDWSHVVPFITMMIKPSLFKTSLTSPIHHCYGIGFLTV